MICYVLGNGFDLHYGLNTSYHAFKEFLENYPDFEIREIPAKMDELFFYYWESNNEHDCTNDIKYWSRLEDMLTVFNTLDPAELLDEAYKNSEQDDERADYLDSPSWNVEYQNLYIRNLKEKLSNWIEGLDVRIKKDKYFQPKVQDLILSFNYTKTVEENFEIPVVHIHGTVGGDIVFGHNKYQKPDFGPVVRDEDSDYRSTKAEESAYNVIDMASKLYYKNSNKILNDYKLHFEHISQCEKVVILGCSCGGQDEIYFNEIIKRAKYIEYYYHGEKDEETSRINKILKKHDKTHKYIEW